jgi:hypothetical protein
MINRPELPERDRQMAEFSVGQDGLCYHYNGYRYNKWQDAVTYARLMHDRPSQANAACSSFVPSKPFAPTIEAEQAQD